MIHEQTATLQGVEITYYGATDDDSDYPYFEATIDGELVGVLHMTVGMEGWYISKLWVEPEYRRKRIGTDLMNACIGFYGSNENLYLFAAGISSFRDIEPVMRSDQLFEFYRTFGFQDTDLYGEMRRPAGAP
jgi:GNAT superfamily N-acetyltransferase